MSRFGKRPDQASLGIRNRGEQIGHEVGHFLLEYAQIDDLNLCSHEHTPDDNSYASRVMYPHVAFTVGLTDDERDNIWAATNPYNPWIEHF